MKSGFYGLIPKVVRHHKELKSNTKLLYAEISACINEDGVCTEKNIYFQKVLNIGKTTLDSSLRQLRLHGFIQIVMEIEENSNKFLKRYITLTPTTWAGRVSIKNQITYTDDTGGDEEFAPLISNGEDTAISGSLLYNNNIITKVYTKPKKRHTPINKNMNDKQKDALIKIVNEFYNTQQFRHPNMVDGNWQEDTTILNGSINTLYDLIKIDGFDYESIRDVIVWALNDKFWSNNLLSLKVLRNKAGNGFTKFQNLHHTYKNQ